MLRFFTSNNSSTDDSENQTLPHNETINIFSIASGHLYERFLRYQLICDIIDISNDRIMMLSVLKHTKNPVKFWFLKNYLSPQFKVNSIQ